jgi:hypothetical protein
MASARLPTEFSDLEPYAAKWCLTTERERYDERLSSSMREIQDFYDAAAARAGEAIAYCDTFPLAELPERARNLLHLVYSLLTVSFAVECWAQPRVPDTGAAYLDCLDAPVP